MQHLICCFQTQSADRKGLNTFAYRPHAGEVHLTLLLHFRQMLCTADYVGQSAGSSARQERFIILTPPSCWQMESIMV